MAAATDPRAARVLTALAWAAAAYLLALLAAYYHHLWRVERRHLESASFILVGLLLAAALGRRGGGTPAANHQRHVPALTLIALLLAIAAMHYSFVVFTGLFADDYVLLEAARAGRLTVWADLFRPVVFVVWRTADRATGHTGPVLHLLNIVLHVVNGLLVAVLAGRMGLARWTGAAAGVLFVCFPGAVEAVAWPAGMQDVLMATFVLGFLALIAHWAGNWRRLGWALGLLLLALLTKETAVAAPALAILVAAAARGPRRGWLAVAAAVLLVGLFLAIRFAALPLPPDYGVSLDRYTIKELIVRPFATLVAPVRDARPADAPALALLLRWSSLALAAMFTVTLSAAAARWGRQDRDLHVVLASALFVLAAVGPVHTYFHVTADLHGTRYLYLAGAGWSILLSVVLNAAVPRPGRAGAVFVAVVFCLWSMSTGLQRHAWQEAAGVRDRILLAAARTSFDRCPRWSVTGLPDVVRGVPVFINGFPEAMRAAGRAEQFRVAPGFPDADECRAAWTGRDFEITTMGAALAPPPALGSQSEFSR